MVYAAFIDLNRAIANQVIQHLVIMESHSVAMKISQLGILPQPTRAKKAGKPRPQRPQMAPNSLLTIM